MWPIAVNSLPGSIWRQTEDVLLAFAPVKVPEAEDDHQCGVGCQHAELGPDLFPLGRDLLAEEQCP